MEQLIVGSIVHYMENLGYGQPPKCTAAIVIDVYDKAAGNINVREFGNLHIRSTLYSENKEGGTWHWPERT
jgi:hypothetical protein